MPSPYIQIVLASRSPWRRRLMKRHGVPHAVHASAFRELKKHQNPRSLALHNACGKARTVAAHYDNALVVGVDTIGVAERKILGKPTNRAQARRMLQMLSGTTHRVLSGVCVIDTRTGRIFKTVITTRVTFKKIEAAALERYLDSGHWKGKAGAYAIQGRAKGFVKKIDGDKTNVVGIPMEYLAKLLKKLRAAP